MKTVTLDDDVAAKVDEAARTTGQNAATVVNGVLRRALDLAPTNQPPRPIDINPVSLGRLRPGLSLDCTAELLGQLDEIERH